MNSFITSQIRTYVPVAVGVFLSWLLSRGIVLDEQTTNGLVAFLTGVLIAIYYFVARLIERKYPQAGQLLLGSAKQPTYREVK